MQNIHIMPIYGKKLARIPKSGHMIFGHNWNSAIFWPIMGIQQTIIYRLVVRNPRYDAMLIFDFLGHFWWENRRGHYARSSRFGAFKSKPDQDLTHWVSGWTYGPFVLTTISRNFQRSTGTPQNNMPSYLYLKKYISFSVVMFKIITSCSKIDFFVCSINGMARSGGQMDECCTEVFCGCYNAI